MGEHRDAVIEWLAQQARELREARQARDILVYMLGLEPVAGRLGGRATWDDVVDYVAKVQGSRDLAMDTIRRRQHLLAAALDLPDDTPHPALIRRVIELTRVADRP